MVNEIKAIFKFEGMAFDFVENEIKAIVSELSKPEEYRSKSYIDEKLRNIINQFEGTMHNFKRRIEFVDMQKEFMKVYENMQGDE